MSYLDLNTGIAIYISLLSETGEQEEKKIDYESFMGHTFVVIVPLWSFENKLLFVLISRSLL